LTKARIADRRLRQAGRSPTPKPGVGRAIIDMQRDFCEPGGFDGLLAECAMASYFPQFKRAVLEMATPRGGIVGWPAPVAAILEAIH
jgi:hypothetical protein